MSTDEIDALLECYLQLLDQYTTLRTELGTLQSSIHQDIARANFSSDRGIRYGQDYYDSRMRASRLFEIEPLSPEISTPVFAIKTAPIKSAETEDGQVPETAAPQILQPQPPSRDPLHMFPTLSLPSTLRSAQRSAITMVERVIPQLASVDAEMRECEIQIRRARKYHKRALDAKPAKNQQKIADSAVTEDTGDSALRAMATRDDPAPPGVYRNGPAPPYVEVRFAEQWE